MCPTCFPLYSFQTRQEFFSFPLIPTWWPAAPMFCSSGFQGLQIEVFSALGRIWMSKCQLIFSPKVSGPKHGKMGKKILSKGSIPSPRWLICARLGCLFSKFFEVSQPKVKYLPLEPFGKYFFQLIATNFSISGQKLDFSAFHPFLIDFAFWNSTWHDWGNCYKQACVMIYGALGQLELKESRFCWKTSKSFYQNLKLRLDLQKGCQSWRHTC